MYAWRALGLKDGRNGTRGAGDFEIKEGSDDDGERWAADKILKVLRDRSAVDTLVVCCRWYGGTQIGPIRFQLIEETSNQSLKAHLLLADVQPHKIELLARDARITHLRSLLPPAPPPAPSSSQPDHAAASVVKNAYEGLTIEKADRLLVAREKTIEGLERKVTELGGSGGVEAGRKDLKRRVEEVLGDEEEEEEEEDDEFTRMERSLALKAKGKAKEKPRDLPSFTKKKKTVDVVVISDDDDDEEQAGVVGGQDDDDEEEGGDAPEEDEDDEEARVEKQRQEEQTEEVDG
ncbi:hypothetical protein BDY24DRAFT_51351 [Mrakia frigida]|uniref:YigZ family protein n=1 Tax=Mrakia frigida TaxID=29902 RepID=UPI003FCC1E1E